MLKRKMLKGLVILGVSMFIVGGNASITNASAPFEMNVSRIASASTPTKMSISNIASNSTDSIENKVDDIQYIVLRESESYNRYETANIAFKENSHQTPTVFIDDFTILDAMDYAPYEHIASSGSAINCNNSIEIYFPVNQGVDFHRAVANFVLYYRSELKNKFPNAKLITKTEALNMSKLEELGMDTNHNKILTANSSWWTFDKIVELCSNEELIPFIDYCPVEDKHSSFNMNPDDYLEYRRINGKESSIVKESFPVFEGVTIRESINSQIVEIPHEHEESDEIEEETNDSFFDKIKNFLKKI